MAATVEQLREAIGRERTYQDAKWGAVEENPHSLAGWLLIAERELNEAIEAWITKKGDGAAKAELLQMVSVGVACFEQEQGSGDLEERFYIRHRQPRSLEEALGVSRHLFREAWESLLWEDGPMAICRIKGAIGTGLAALLQHGIIERGEL